MRRRIADGMNHFGRGSVRRIGLAVEQIEHQLGFGRTARTRRA